MTKSQLRGENKQQHRMSKPLKSPKSIYFALGIPKSGIPHFAAALANALQVTNSREIAMYAPAEILSIYKPSPRNKSIFSTYYAFEGKWGVNQWKFAFQSLLHFIGLKNKKNFITHLHTPSLMTPNVYTVHGLYSATWLRNPKPGMFARLQFTFLSALEKKMVRRSDKVVFVSRQNQEYAEQAFKIKRPNAFHVINPGVDCEKFSDRLRSDLKSNRLKYFPKLDASARWFLFVGTDYERKGLPKILEACLQENRANQNWKLLIFGKDAAAKLKVEALANQMPGRVVFFDSDEHLPEAFGLCDILVMDSFSEGYPLVLLEALAGGCIPFVTQFEGADEAVAVGKTGFLFSNSKELIISALATSPELLEAMRAKARAFALNHSWNKTAESYEAIYRQFDPKEPEPT
jgi:glycosyltransferase involved in cell wall biosynthesis